MALSLGGIAHGGLSEQLYFLRYVAHHMADRSLARQEHPITMPAQLPSTTEIAQTIASQVGAENFLRGASTSEHQCSTQCTPEICSWSRFAQQHGLPQPADKKNGMDLWRYYREYFDYAVDTLKLNAIRFSIEWALVQPDADSWDGAVLDHYANMVIYAIKKGIAPVICFHHYTDPNWFLDQGGFEKEENICPFVTYCMTVYEHIMTAIKRDPAAVAALNALAPRQPLWATFNAPDGYAFRGYRQKQGPPADEQRSGLAMVATVNKNALEAHVQVYYSLKKQYKESAFDEVFGEPAVGILKNIHQIDPATDTWFHAGAAPLTKAMAAVADMIQNGSFYSFFTQGEYRVHVPFAINICHKNEAAVGALDFIGLNYYSNRHLYFTKTVPQNNPDLATDGDIYYRYPAGIYRAIVELHEKIVQPYTMWGKKIPLIVAENGIATTDDAKRDRFYHEYLYAISKAIEDGYPVYGYLPWTLATNYEWPVFENNTARDYGLCAIDEHDPSKLIVKAGSRSYHEFTQAIAQQELVIR